MVEHGGGGVLGGAASLPIWYGTAVPGAVAARTSTLNHVAMSRISGRVVRERERDRKPAR